MFIELVDSLRCLSTHEDTWLVASVWRMDGRHIVEGMLGCPVCRREYPVRNGVAWFSALPAPSPSDTVAGTGADALHPTGPTANLAEPDDADRVARAAALLGLSDPGGIVALLGDWERCAEALAELGAAHVVLLGGSPSPDRWPQISSLRVDDRLPFAAGSVRGIALGRSAADAASPLSSALLASAVEALRARGRLVAPSAMPVPEGVDELARDEADWVAERRAVASPPVVLRSARR